MDARSCTNVAVLIDTDVFVHRYDPRFPRKQEIANMVLRSAIESGQARIPQQVHVEFVAAMNVVGADSRLLDSSNTLREAEAILAQFPILYPNEAVLRTALLGAVSYGMSWIDAQFVGICGGLRPH